MDRSSLRTSVVIEVANQEEPEDQKTYHIDFDDLDIPKDYVIDQVFCGENITVYALFEVPENSKKLSNDNILDVTNSKANDSYKLFQTNSSKKIMDQRKPNGYKPNLMNPDDTTMNILPSKDHRNGSYYCLKHLTGDYDVLTPERENSELKVLYCKSIASRNSKSTKFKAVSKGVNTDIVQSPRIIQEVQKAVRQSEPFSKAEGKTHRVKSVSSNKPSYEVIEMEMRQSFSSLSSYGDCKKVNKKSVPNFFLVPLLMMEDGVLSHFQSDDKKHAEEKERKAVLPEKVSMGTNTDMLLLKPTFSEHKKYEDAVDMSPSGSLKSENEIQKKLSSNSKISGKNTILNEIKKLQGKLNALVKSIESDAFDFDASESAVLDKPQPEKLETSEGLLSECKSFKTNWKKYDDMPILSTLTYPQCKTVKRKQPDKSIREHKEEIVVTPTKSNSIGFISSKSSSNSQLIRSSSFSNYRDCKSKEKLKKVSSIVWSELENRKGVGLSKSMNGLYLLDPKFNLINGLKKSLSFDLRDVKLEVACLKKIRNISFKLETKPNIRIPQKGEAIMKCEMGDEACNKPKTSKIDLLSLSKPIEKVDDFKLEKKNLDTKKNLKEEEGDAKLVYSKQNLLTHMIARKAENFQVHFCNITPNDNLLTVEKNIPATLIKPRGMYNLMDVEQKTCNLDKPTTPNKTSDSDKPTTPNKTCDSDKPTTPNKTCRKQILPNNNAKKEVKTVKKLNLQLNNKIKLRDKPTKPEVKEVSITEAIKQKSVTGSRKFTLKGTAETKLHVDRLMKTETSISPRQPGIRASRLPCQKRESADPTVNCDESKEKNEKPSKTNSPTRNRKEECARVGLEKIEEDGREEAAEVVSNQSGVVVELLSEKPPETLYPEESQKSTNIMKTLEGGVILEKNDKSHHEEVNEDSLSPEKPVVKSVWALTKVLMFEDGSKKVEILEASLSPPGYSLPKTPSVL